MYLKLRHIKEAKRNWIYLRNRHATVLPFATQKHISEVLA